MSGRTAVLLSARDKATRLPGKTLQPIHGKPAIEHLIDRLRGSREAARVVLATSDDPGDDALVDLAESKGIASFRGSADDKLTRYLDAATAFGLDFVVVVDGDDLFADPVFVDQILRAQRAQPADYIVVAPLPVGATGFGVDVEALRRVVERKAERDTEVWGGYFTGGGFECRVLAPENPEWARPDLRMTLDYPEDLTFFQAVFAELHRPGEVFSFGAILELLRQRPGIAALNQGVQARYEERLRATTAARWR